MSPHYLAKCNKSHFSITLIIGASCLFELLPDKTDSSCHNTVEVITFTYFLAYCFVFVMKVKVNNSIIIIVIIKKVKIIVTLSIKNTAGALYKSQEFWFCSQPPNNLLFLTELFKKIKRGTSFGTHCISCVSGA